LNHSALVVPSIFVERCELAGLLGNWNCSLWRASKSHACQTQLECDPLDPQPYSVYTTATNKGSANAKKPCDCSVHYVRSKPSNISGGKYNSQQRLLEWKY